MNCCRVSPVYLGVTVWACRGVGRSAQRPRYFGHEADSNGKTSYTWISCSLLTLPIPPHGVARVLPSRSYALDPPISRSPLFIHARTYTSKLVAIYAALLQVCMYIYYPRIS